jgi:hypothetical protein
MQEIDPSVHRALKSAASYDGTPKSRERAVEQLRTALEGIRDPEPAAAAKSIHEYLLARRRRKEIGDPVSPPLKDLLALRSLERSYELALGELVADSPDLECGELLQMAPSLRVIEAWLKSAEERRVKAGDDTRSAPPKEELIKFVKRDPDLAAACGLGEWFVGNVPADSLLETLPLLAAAFSLKVANRRETLVNKVIFRDRSGNLLLRCVHEVATTAERLRELARIIRTDAKTLQKVLDLLPDALLGSEDGRLGELVPMLFDDLCRSKGSRRRLGNGMAVALFGLLLAVEGESTGLKVALEGLRELFQEFESQAETGNDERDFLWVVKQTGAPKKPEHDRRQTLSLEQANLLGAAVERLRANPGAIGVMEAPWRQTSGWNVLERPKTRSVLIHWSTKIRWVESSPETAQSSFVQAGSWVIESS